MGTDDARAAAEPETEHDPGSGLEAEPGVEAEQEPKPSTRRKIFDWIGVLLIAAAAALGARTFVVQAYYIPSESMVETLEVNDRVIVSKLTYRFADFSRGDVIVFDCPDDMVSCPVDDFIKRVIALPGETIRFRSGDVYIDGVLLHEPYVGTLPTWSSGVPTRLEGCAESVVTDRCTVRDGWVYVMGDNRPQSRDSRWFGPIPQSTVAGRAAFKVWPVTDLGPL